MIRVFHERLSNRRYGSTRFTLELINNNNNKPAEMEKLAKLLFFFMMFGTSMAYSQSIVTGEVVDEKSEPLIGVTVMVKGTTIGASTDIDGKFSLSARTGDILSVSYVGFVYF